MIGDWIARVAGLGLVGLLAACARPAPDDLLDTEALEGVDTDTVDTAEDDKDTEDTEVVDEGPDLVAACAVPDLITVFPTNLPNSPASNRPMAPECVQDAHDAILILGCPTSASGLPAACQRERVALALRFHAQGYGDWFIVSGGAVANEYVEADMLAQLLEEEGVSPARIVKEPQAEHTDENLYYSGVLMQARGWNTALVISEPGHLYYTATCDANCCVEKGRLTVLTFPLTEGDVMVGTYVLYPDAAPVTEAECDHIQGGAKLMCTQLSSRKACADDFQL